MKASKRLGYCVIASEIKKPITGITLAQVDIDLLKINEKNYNFEEINKPIYMKLLKASEINLETIPSNCYFHNFDEDESTSDEIILEKAKKLVNEWFQIVIFCVDLTKLKKKIEYQRVGLNPLRLSKLLDDLSNMRFINGKVDGMIKTFNNENARTKIKIDETSYLIKEIDNQRDVLNGRVSSRQILLDLLYLGFGFVLGIVASFLFLLYDHNVI